jgi:hypothetical protein
MIIIRYADDVRHITWRWIPFPERRGLEEMTLGPTAYPAVKAKGDSSMPIKRKWSEDAYGHGLQGPRDRVRPHCSNLSLQRCKHTSLDTASEVEAIAIER